MFDYLSEGKLDSLVEREDYLKFLDDELESNNEWYGVSIQLHRPFTGNENIEEKISLCRKIEPVFRALIGVSAQLATWVLCHEDRIMPWFYDHCPSEYFPLLLTTLKEVGLESTAKTALRGTSEDILSLSNEIVMYPTVMMYKDLDCYNLNDDIIVKTTGHICVDIISKEQHTLNKYLDLIDGLDEFALVHYNHIH